MVAIPRKTAKIFGSTATGTQISQFGSLAAAAPAFSTDPDTIQSLPNWLSGWFAAVIGANSPAIEDMNAFCYVMAYQVAYILQQGIPEWISTTTYFTKSFVSDGAGGIYVSLVNDNTNQALTDTTKWRRINGPNVVAQTASVVPSTILTAADTGKEYVITTDAACSFTLPTTAAKNLEYCFKDASGNAPTYPITLIRAGSEKIENYAGSYVMEASYGYWRLVCTDGTNWAFMN